jgi:hypothetical protein
LDPDVKKATDKALYAVIAEWDRLKHVEAEAIAIATAESAPSSSPLPPEKPQLALSEKELARQYAMRYAYVEGDLAELYIDDGARPQGAPPKGTVAGEAEAKKLAEEKRLQVLEALKLDGKKKKHKQQQEGACHPISSDIVVDLLAPNLNRDKVNMRVQMEREAQRKASQTVRDRDKAALEKQK